jgi:ATP-binding cassette subfamily F protein 3
MKALGEEMKEKYGPGSEFANKIKEQTQSDTNLAKAGKKAAKKPTSPEARTEATSKDRRRKRRIQELEAQIRKLVDEIKALRADDDGEKNPEK